MNFEKFLSGLFGNNITNIVVFDGKKFRNKITEEHFVVLPDSNRISNLLRPTMVNNRVRQSNDIYYRFYDSNMLDIVNCIFGAGEITNIFKEDERKYKYYICMSRSMYEVMEGIYNEAAIEQEQPFSKRLDLLDTYSIFSHLTELSIIMENNYLQNVETITDLLTSDRKLLRKYHTIYDVLSKPSYEEPEYILHALHLYVCDKLSSCTFFEDNMSNISEEVSTILNMMLSGNKNTATDIASIFRYHNRVCRINIVTDMFNKIVNIVNRDTSAPFDIIFNTLNIDFHGIGDGIDDGPGKPVNVTESYDNKLLAESLLSIRDTIKNRYIEYSMSRKERNLAKKKKKLNLLILDIGREIEVLRSRAVNLITESEKKDTLSQLYDLKYELSEIEGDATNVNDYELGDTINDKLNYIDEIIDTLQRRELRLERRTIHLKLDKTFTDQVKDK